MTPLDWLNLVDVEVAISVYDDGTVYTSKIEDPMALVVAWSTESRCSSLERV